MLSGGDWEKVLESIPVSKVDTLFELLKHGFAQHRRCCIQSAKSLKKSINFWMKLVLFFSVDHVVKVVVSVKVFFPFRPHAKKGEFGGTSPSDAARAGPGFGAVLWKRRKPGQLLKG